MRSQSWFGKLWKRLGSGVVQDVPPRLEECEICREVECSQGRWESCERRLATEAAGLRARASELSASAPNRTAEVPPSEGTAEVVRGPKPASS